MGEKCSGRLAKKRAREGVKEIPRSTGHPAQSTVKRSDGDRSNAKNNGLVIGQTNETKLIPRFQPWKNRRIMLKLRRISC